MFYEDGITVTLSPNDQAICNFIGSMRVYITSQYKSKLTDGADKNPLPAIAYDVDGAMSELAFCKHFNVFYDCSFTYEKDSFDCLYLGKRFDIKATRTLHGRLIDGLYSNPNVDFYVLALILDHKTVKFVGYISAANFKNESNIMNFYGKDSYVVEQNKLLKFKKPSEG